jgi:hypothetical protein
VSQAATTRGRALGGFEAAWILARLGWRRLARGKALWILLAAGLVPVVFALVARGGGDLSGWRDVFVLVTLYLAVLAPRLIGASIAEEFEDRTFTYLWSRPLPRLSLALGKLLVGLPAVFALAATSAIATGVVVGEPGAVPRGLAALAAGTLGYGLMAAGIASIAPRLAQRLTYVYVFALDLTMGELPVSLREISVSYHVRHLAGVQRDGGMLTVGGPADLLACLAIGGVIFAIGAWRLRVAEHGGGGER